MSDAVIFSDLMSHLVSQLSTKLSAQGYSSTRVGVKADNSTSQVILRRDGGSRLSKTIMQDSVGVNVYAASYGTAEALALVVMALFDDLPDGNPITDTVPESSIQDVSDLQGERRFLRFAVNHRGTDLT